MPRALATDAISVRTITPRVWDEGPCWPVSDEVFDAIVDRLFDRFRDVARDLAPPERLGLLVLHGDLTVIARSVHLRLAHHLATRDGVAVLRRGAAFEPPPWSRELSPDVGAGHGSRRGTPRRAIVRLGKRWLFNSHHGLARRVSTVLTGSPVALLGSMSTLVAADCDARRQALDVIPVEDLVDTQMPPTSIPTPRSRAAIEAALVAVEGEIARIGGVGFGLVELADVLATRIAGAADMIARARARLPRSLTTLYVNEIGKPRQRIVAAAASEAGVEVTTVNHGFYAAETALDEAVGFQHVFSSRVVGYNATNARRLASSFQASRMASFGNPTFVSAGDFDGMPARPLARPPEPGSRPSSVMIVGYPMNDARYLQSAGHFFAFQLSAERALAQAFRAAGVRVIYKVHPERVAEADGLFADLVDEVLGGAFESQMERADAFVFASHLTTTFNIAVGSGKPCFVLDIPGMRWSPDARETLSGAVRFIPAAFDGLGRLHPLPGAVDMAIARQDPLDAGPYVRAFLGQDGG